MHSDTLMTNFDHSIDDAVASDLMHEKLVGEYTAWNFYGLVWWDPVRMLWCCEVWQYGDPVRVLRAKTLQGIMDHATERYGRE